MKFEDPYQPNRVSTGQEGIDDAMLNSIISNYQEGGVVKQLASFYAKCLAAGTLSLGGSTGSLVGLGGFVFGLSAELQPFFYLRYTRE